MRQTISKITFFLCVICMVFAANTLVFAADADPTIVIETNESRQAADISIKDAGVMIYAAQITLNINGGSPDNIVCADENMYGTIKTDGNRVTLYIASRELLSGSGEVKLATLSANKAMTIGGIADLVLVDYSMRPLQYDNVTVSASDKQTSSKNPSQGGGGGGAVSDGGLKVVVNDNSNPAKRVFSDVAESHWAKASIDYVVEKGLFSGTSDYTFEPSQDMTRAMYVVVLKRFGTNIDAKWNIPCDNPWKFSDIPDGRWYSEAVAWAGGTGVVTGVGENQFDPDSPITREQMAVMTVNFAKLCGVELPSKVQASSFADEADIHDWAVSAVHAAQQAGIIQGRDGNMFAPQETATRAEVAAIMQRFVEAVK